MACECCGLYRSRVLDMASSSRNPTPSTRIRNRCPRRHLCESIRKFLRCHFARDSGVFMVAWPTRVPRENTNAHWMSDRRDVVVGVLHVVLRPTASATRDLGTETLFDCRSIRGAVAHIGGLRAACATKHIYAPTRILGAHALKQCFLQRDRMPLKSCVL